MTRVAATTAKEFPTGRRCETTDCITILNRYNRGPHCLICTQKQGHTQAEREATEITRLMSEPPRMAA